jgi:hypothetical protein
MLPLLFVLLREVEVKDRCLNVCFRYTSHYAQSLY